MFSRSLVPSMLSLQRGGSRFTGVTWSAQKEACGSSIVLRLCILEEERALWPYV